MLTHDKAWQGFISSLKLSPGKRSLSNSIARHRQTITVLPFGGSWWSIKQFFLKWEWKRENIGKKMDPSEVKLILLAIGKQLMRVKAKIPSSSVPHLHNLNTLTYVICWPVQKILLEIGISIYCVYCICLVYKYCNLQEDRKSESYWTSGNFFLGLMYYIITMNQPKKCMQEILAWPMPGFYPGAYLDWRQGR